MRRGLTLLVCLLLAVPAAAQNREVPFWASLRATEAYMRVGPSEDFPIDWVYRRQGLPVKVLRINQGWRFVEDPDGTRGWIHSSLLTPVRGAIVVGDGLAEMHEAGDADARVLWRAEPGVVGARKGWIRAARLWGPGEP